MRSLLTGRTRRYATDAARAFERAPVEVAVVVLLGVAFSYTVEAGGLTFRTWFELAAGGLLVFMAAWTGTLLHALGAWDARRRWAVALAAALAAVLYVAFIADFERAAEAWRAAMLASAAVVWITAVPVLAPNWGAAEGLTATDRMRVVTGRVLLRTLGAGLYCGALYLGLALAIGAVNTLFELRLDGNIYAHTLGWIFVVLGPWIVIGGLQDYVRPPEPRNEVANVVNRMAAFLVPPLLAIYYAILFAYTIRIGVTGEVPKNLVSPLVFAAGILAALGLLLFDPRSREATAFRTLRAAPPLFLPLAALGAWAISLRVAQYGWTEFRLVRLMLLLGMAVLALGATIQVVRRQRLALHIIPLGLAGLLLVSAVGPWSVLSTARRSQQARLDRALAALPPAPDGAADTVRRQVPAELFSEVSGSARYLVEHFGLEALPPAVAAVVARREDAWDAAARLGLEPVGRPQLEEAIAAHLPQGAVVPVGGITLRRVTGAGGARRVASEEITVVQDSTVLRIRADGETLTADFTALADAMVGAHRGAVRDRRLGQLRPDGAGLPVHDAAGRLRGSLVVLDALITLEESGYVLQRLDGLLVLERVTDADASPVR